jgi:hypothetical protein
MHFVPDVVRVHGKSTLYVRIDDFLYVGMGRQAQAQARMISSHRSSKPVEQLIKFVLFLFRNEYADERRQYCWYVLYRAHTFTYRHRLLIFNYSFRLLFLFSSPHSRVSPISVSLVTQSTAPVNLPPPCYFWIILSLRPPHVHVLLLLPTPEHTLSSAAASTTLLMIHWFPSAVSLLLPVLIHSTHCTLLSVSQLSVS